jgi:chromosome segregation ATPase
MTTNDQMPRPTPEELQLAIMVTRPGAHIGSGVACTLLGELLALREEMRVQAVATLHFIEQRDLALDAGKAAELRIVDLREELAEMRTELHEARNKHATYENQLRKLREALACQADAREALRRVEALLNAWRAETANLQPPFGEDVQFCIDDLDEALRGPT